MSSPMKPAQGKVPKPPLTIVTPNLSEIDPADHLTAEMHDESEISSVSTLRTPLTGKGSTIHTPATQKSSVSLHFDRLYPDILETEDNIEYALTHEIDPNSVSRINFVDNLNQKEQGNLDISQHSNVDMQDIYQDVRSPMYSGNALFFLEASKLSTNLTFSSHVRDKSEVVDPSLSDKSPSKVDHHYALEEDSDDKDVSTMSPASHTLLLSDDVSFTWDDGDGDTTVDLTATSVTHVASHRPPTTSITSITPTNVNSRYQGYIDQLYHIFLDQLQPSHVLDLTACSSEVDLWMEKTFPEEVVRCVLPVSSPLLAEMCVIVPRSVLTVTLLLWRVTEVSLLSGVRWYLFLCLWPFRKVETTMWRLCRGLLQRSWREWKKTPTRQMSGTV